MRLRLNPPPDVKASNEVEVRSVREAFKSRKAKLGKTKRKLLDTRLRRMLEAHERGTAGLRSKLQRLNEFYEGAEEAIDFPFGPEASSKIDLRLAAGYGRLLRAQFIRSVFSDPEHTYAMLSVPGFQRTELNQVERSINWLAENRDNLNETLKDTFIPAYRDGTAPLHGHWERRIERGCEYKTYTVLEEFQADYPTADDAGISEVEYEEALNSLMEPNGQIFVEYQVDFVAANGPEFTCFPLAKFIFYPFYQEEMSKLAVYGYSYIENKGKFEHNAKYGYYDAEPVEACRKKTPEARMDARASWENQLEALEGLSDMVPDAVSYNLAWLCYTGDLDEDGIDERYSVIYDLDKNRSLRVETYDVPRNIPCIVPQRLIRRPGRLLGDSMLAGAEHLFREINALHRHRSNTRRITDSITMLFPNTLKDEVDLGAEYGSMRPGLTLWVPDQYMNTALSPRQLVIQGTSKTNESVDEEQFIQRYMDLLLGATQGQSGRESAADPNAPASKTAMLLNRADTRVEDLIDEWRRTIPHLLDLYMALYVQNASQEIKIVSQNGEAQQDETVPVQVFSKPGLRGVLKPMKPNLLPEVEAQKIAALMAGAKSFMIPLQMKPDILIQGWNDYVAALRVERPERYQIQPNGAMGGAAPAGPAGQPSGVDQIMAMLGITSGAKAAPASKPPASGGGGLDLGALIRGGQ